MISLTDNQMTAIDKLGRLKCGALFMDMGTGKTRCALELMRSKKDKCDYFAWFCPVSIMSEIEAERLKWAPDIELHVWGLESLSASDRIYCEVTDAIKAHSSFVVVDESLKIKNIGAKRTRRMLALGKLAKYRLLLNGTPISNNIVDLWSQMQFLSPAILGMNKREFERRFCVFNLVRPKGRLAVKRLCGQANIPALMAMIEPYVFDSRLQDEVKREHHVIKYRVDEGEYRTAKALIMDEYRFSNDLVSWFAVISRCQRWYCQNGDWARALSDLLKSIQEPVIVFVKFLESIPFDACKITGETPVDERRLTLERFTKGEVKTLWLTYGVGAFGLNLQTSHHMVFLEHSWDYAQRIQAEARIARMGQAETCHFYDFVCDNAALEHKIQDALARKSDFRAEVVEGLSDL